MTALVFSAVDPSVDRRLPPSHIRLGQLQFTNWRRPLYRTPPPQALYSLTPLPIPNTPAQDPNPLESLAGSCCKLQVLPCRPAVSVLVEDPAGRALGRKAELGMPFFTLLCHHRLAWGLSDGA